MAEDKNGPDAAPRIGLDLGRQVLDSSRDSNPPQEQGKPSEEMIRERACEIWEREGRSGDPQDHWYSAERELGELSQERSEATVEDAPPAAVVDAFATVDSQTAEENKRPQKSRRKRTS